MQGLVHGQEARRKDAAGTQPPVFALHPVARIPGPPCPLDRRFGSFLARLAGLVAVCLLASPAFAFRCGSHIVSEGDTRAQVLARCGEPADVSRSEIQRRVWLGGPRGHNGYGSGNDFVVLPVEYWVYNLGPNRLMQRVRFIDGVVVEVESLGYGYYEPDS
jgi:hypothetical protein